jgi:hypothetical protein
VQFDHDILYQGMPLGMPQGAGTHIRFSGRGQRLKPFGFSLALAASLKRSPETNPISETDVLPQNGGRRA